MFSVSSTYGDEKFPNPRDFFEIAIKKQTMYDGENFALIELDKKEVAPSFLRQVAEKNTGDPEQPKYFFLRMFEQGRLLECHGSIIKDTDFKASAIPAEFQDRAGMVYLNSCRENNKSYPLEVIYYQVFPKTETLPKGNFTERESYRMYEHYKGVRPHVMCTSADVNMAKVPRSQSVVHVLDDMVSFSVHSSESSVPVETETGLDWGDDRAAVVDPMNRKDVAKTLSTLNFMSVRMKGAPYFVFDREKDCQIKYKSDENPHAFIGEIACETTLPNSRPITFTPEKEFYDGEMTLKKVRASVLSTEEKAFGGTNDDNEKVYLKQINYRYRYDFTFSTAEGDKHLSYMLRYKNLFDKGPNECLQRPLEETLETKMKNAFITEVKEIESPIVTATDESIVRSCQRPKADETIISTKEEKTIFKTTVDWSNPETPFAKVKFDELDQSSLKTENVVALDFLKNQLKGKLDFDFITEQDCGRAEDGKLGTLVCEKYVEEDKMITFTPMEEYHPVPLVLAAVTTVFETRNDITLAGFDESGEALTKDVYKNLVTYQLTFASQVSDEERSSDPFKYRLRYLIYKFEYQDIPADEKNSCQLNNAK